MLEQPKVNVYQLGENDMNETMVNQQATLKELSWLGGIVDGEGCVGIRHNTMQHQFSPRFNVTNTNMKIINETVSIIRKIGVNPYIREKKPSGYGLNTKIPCYQVCVDTLSGARLVLEALEPFIIGKGNQVKYLLEFCISRKRFKKTQTNEQKMYNKRELECIKAVYTANNSFRGSSQTKSKATEQFLNSVDDIVGL